MSEKRSYSINSPPKESIVNVQNPFTPQLFEALREILRKPSPLNAFDKFILDAGIEAWAHKTLIDAGLPAFEFPATEYEELVESRFHAGKDKEWHAWNLLRLIWLARGLVRLKSEYGAIYAFELGAAIMDGDIWFGFQAQRRKGGLATGGRTTAKAEARNRPIIEMNEELISKHPSERERAAIIARKLKRPVSTIRTILRTLTK